MSAITAEIQKGHTYYRCSKKNKNQRCSQPYVREEVLDADISALLTPYTLPAGWAEAMLARLDKEKRELAQSAAQSLAEKRTEIEQVNSRLRRLLDGFLDGIVERDDYTAGKAQLMSQKKTLEEQSRALNNGRAHWLEPFEKWIKTAQNAGEIAVSGSPQEKKGLASEIFGSNLVLDGKKARGSTLKPWSLLAPNALSGGMVPRLGLEPRTN